jgi:hypothetical protein
MLPARDQRDGDSSVREVLPAPFILTAESLRGATSSQGTKASKSEEGISVFWRVFGGTLLSIGALVCITLFQQLSNNLSDVRNNLNRLNEGRGDLVKQDDFNTRMASMWNSLKELQVVAATVTTLKERSALLEEHMKAGQDQLGERITGLANSLKDLETANAAISALKERESLLEQQLKAADDERKEMCRDIQRLRERQAALEGRQGVPVTAPAVAPKSSPGSGHR